MKSFPLEFQALLAIERLPLTDSEKGGLRNRFGLCYQELHSLELVKQVLHGELDGFFCERGEDYLGYQLGANHEPTRLSLVQVKSSGADCVFCKTKETVERAIENLTRSFRRFRDLYPSAEITLSLVLSKHELCRGNHEVCTVTHLAARQSGKEVLKSRTRAWPPIDLVFGPPCPPSFQDVCEQLRGVAGPLLDLERLFRLCADQTTFLKLLAGLVIPVVQPKRSPEPDTMPERNPVDPSPLFRNGLHRDKTSIGRDIAQLIALADIKAGVPDHLRTARESGVVSAERCLAQPIGRSRKPAKGSWTFDEQEFAKAAALIETLAVRKVPASAGERVLKSIRHAPGNAALQLERRCLGSDFQTVKSWVLSRKPHRCRIRFIRDFLRHMREVTRSLFVQEEYRLMDAVAADRYLYVPNGDGYEFVLLDVEKLAEVDVEAFVKYPFVLTAPLMNGLRELYYGTRDVTQIQEEVEREKAFNDHAIGDFVDHFEPRGVANIEELYDEFESLFSDELTADLFIPCTKVEERVLDKISRQGQCGILSPVCQWEVQEVSVLDVSSERVKLYLRFTNNHDVGLLCDRHGPREITLGNIAFQKNRFLSLDRAVEMVATPLSETKPEAKPAVCLLESLDAREAFATQFIGRPAAEANEDVSRWLARFTSEGVRQRRAQDRLLKTIRDRHRLENCRLEYLEKTTFAYRFSEVIADEEAPQCVLKLVGGAKQVAEHLKACGYTLENYHGLTAEIDDHKSACLTVVRTLELQQEEEGMVLKLVVPEPATLGFLGFHSGTVKFRDPGAWTVWKQNEFVISRLSSAEARERETRREYPELDADEESSEYVHATWQFVRALFIEAAGSESTAIGRDLIANLLGRDCKVVVIKGAAGTGKTAKAVEIIDDFLTSANCGETFPTPKVLVTAKTHLAVDNFIEALFRRRKSYAGCYRFITPKARSDQKYTNINLEFVETVNAWLKNEPLVLGDGRNEREPARKANEGREIRIPPHLVRSAVISSHVKWRLSKGVSTFTPRELAFYLQRKSSVPFEASEGREVGRSFRDRDVEEVFASSIVASTIDSLDQCPDVFVDIVVVDEASQVDFIEFFKVFLKVFRSRGQEDIAAVRPLTVIFTGDSKQLRPYYRVFSAEVRRRVAREKLGDEVLEPWNFRSAFEVIEKQCQHRTTLNIQRRMNETIGTFVQGIFYSEEPEWLFVKKPILQAISCKDVQWKAERDDTSLFNEKEVDRVIEIAKTLAASGRVAVLTPYKAQRTRIDDAIRTAALGNVGCYTVDSCQGKEFEAVIISTVINFAQNIGSVEFVLDPQRLCVSELHENVPMLTR